MGRYRKIDTRIWNDERFRQFSDSGKLAFMFLLTHPAMTCLGAMRATMDGLAAELGWTPDAIRHAMSDAILAGIVEVDEKASFVALRNWLRYNKPEGPNSIKGGWIQALDLIPECPGKIEVIRRSCQFLASMSEAMQRAILDWIRSWEMASGMPCPMPCRIPEPEPEPEQEQDPEIGSSARPAAGRTSGTTRPRTRTGNGTLPFRAAEALRIIAAASHGRFHDTNPGGQAVLIESWIKTHPDRNVFALLGAYLAAGGEGYIKGDFIDSRWATPRNLDAAYDRAVLWDSGGRKPLNAQGEQRRNGIADDLQDFDGDKHAE